MKNSIIASLTSDLSRLLDENDALRAQLDAEPSGDDETLNIKERFQQAMQQLATVSMSPLRLSAPSPARVAAETTALPGSPGPQYQLLKEEYEAVCRELAARADEVEQLRAAMKVQEAEFCAELTQMQATVHELATAEPEMLPCDVCAQRDQGREALAISSLELEEQLAAAQGTLQQRETELQRVRNELQASQAAQADLEARLQSAAAAHAGELQALVAQHAGQVEALDAQYRQTDYQQRYEQLATENAALRNRLERLVACVRTMRSADQQQANVASMLEQLRQRVQQQMDTMARREREMADERESHGQEVTTLRLEAAEATARADMATSQMAELQACLAAAQTQVEGLQAQEQALSQQLEEQRDAHAAIARELADMQAARAALQQDVTRLEAANAAHAEADAQHAAELSRLHADIDLLEAAKAESLAKLAELSEETNALLPQYEEQLLETHKLNEQVSSRESGRRKKLTLIIT